jgi:hypothetical protein
MKTGTLIRVVFRMEFFKVKENIFIIKGITTKDFLRKESNKVTVIIFTLIRVSMKETGY